VVFVGHSVGGAVAARAACLLLSTLLNSGHLERPTAGPDCAPLAAAARAVAGSVACGAVVTLDASTVLLRPAAVAAMAAADRAAPPLWPSLADAEAAVAAERALSEPAARLSTAHLLETVMVPAHAFALARETFAGGDRPSKAREIADTTGSVGELSRDECAARMDDSERDCAALVPAYRARVPAVALRALWGRWYAPLPRDMALPWAFPATQTESGAEDTLSSATATEQCTLSAVPRLMLFSSPLVADETLRPSTGLHSALGHRNGGAHSHDNASVRSTASGGATVATANTASVSANARAATMDAVQLEAAVVAGSHWMHETDSTVVAVRLLQFLEKHALLEQPRYH